MSYLQPESTNLPMDLDQFDNLGRQSRTKSNKNKPEGRLAILVKTSHSGPSGTARERKLPVHVGIILLQSCHSRTSMYQSTVTTRRP
jgi:hypothetical protein